MYALSRLVLLLSVLGLTGCALFVPEPQVIDVIAPTVIPATGTPTGIIPEVNPTPSPTLTIESSQIPLPVVTLTTTTGLTLPTIIQTLIPTFTPSPTPTSTPIVVVFLTPTADWQSVQVGHAMIEIPLDWLNMQFPGSNEAGVTYFVNIDPNLLPPGVPYGEGLARVEYSEGNPDPSPEEWETVTVDGYFAKFTISVDSDFSENPLWIGVLRIHTPERRHNIGLRCWAASIMGEPRQREFHAYCESIIQHWIETTQIVE